MVGALGTRARACALAAALVVAAMLVFFARPALADGRTDFLAGRLKADDFRVRTNAALALGQSDDEGAVPHLCGALSDPSDVVRQAVAVALKRLGKSSALGCLKTRAPNETSAAVKLQLTRAIEALEAGGGSSAPAAAPAVVANAKVYVSLSPVANQTTRAQADVDRVVLSAIKSKLGDLGTVQLAPEHETPEQAKAAISKRKLKGFYLSISVEKFDYSDGNLRVRVKVAVFSYPGKDLRGEVPAGLTQTGVRPGDTSAEDNLMGMAAARAVELFVQSFQ